MSIQIVDNVAAYRRGKRWYLRFTDSRRTPSRKRVSLRTEDQARAMAEARELARDYTLGLYDPWRDRRESVTVLEALRSYIKAQRDIVSPATIDTYEDRVGGLATHVGTGVTVQDVTADDVASYVYRRHLSDTSKYTRYQTISAFFSWVVREGYRRDNPCDDLKKPRNPPNKEVPFAYFSEPQFDQLVRAMDCPHLSRLTRFAVQSGMRLGELCDLQWEDVSLETRTVRIHKAKSGSVGTVRISQQALDVLLEDFAGRGNVFHAPDGKPWRRKRLSKAFKAAVRKAGLPDSLHFHSLRHTYATWLVMKGVSMSVVQRQLRHSTIQMTERYRHFAPDHVRDEIDRAGAAINCEVLR